jgi:hypothetical protein
VSVGGHDHLKLARRHPGAGFGPAHVLRGSGRISSPVVAYGDRGDTVVAYQRQYRSAGGRTRCMIEARLRRAGHHFGSVQRLGSSRGLAWISAAIAPTGRAYALWSEQDAGEEANERLTVNATVAGPRRFLFARARELACATVRARPQGAPRLIVDRSGNATAAWSLPVTRGAARIETAVAAAGHRFGGPVTLASAGIGHGQSHATNMHGVIVAG